MQTVYNLNPPIGLPGQKFDNGPMEVRSFPAHTDIPFGTLTEFVTVSSNREIQVVQDAGTTSSFLPVLAGIALINPMHEQAYVNAGGAAGAGYWRKGEMVAVVRRGRVWAAFDGGGTWPEYAAVRVNHNSDGSVGAGVFTMTAAQTTSHAEIDTAPSCLGIEAGSVQNGTDFSGDTITAAVVSINLAP